jgi:hypothetical protein
MDAMFVQLDLDLFVLYIQVIQELCNYTIVLTYMQWDPADWCSLQPFTRDLQYMLGLRDLWRWHDNKHEMNERRNLGGTILDEWSELIKLTHLLQENGNQCSHIFGNAMLGLITNFDVLLDCTSVCPTEVERDMLPLRCTSVWSSFSLEETEEKGIM